MPLAVVGIALSLASAGWWYLSVRGDHLWMAHVLRVPAWDYLGLDFDHNYRAVRHWLSGRNPYLDDFGDWRGTFAYPPIVLPLFAWCELFARDKAMIAWMAATAGLVALAAWGAVRARSTLHLAPLPVVFVLGLLLVSQPVVFAIERGQCDVIVLALIVAAAMAMQRPARRRDLLAGLCIALAVWVKLYPVALLAGLISLRAWRTLATSMVGVAVIGLVPYGATQQFIETSRAAQQDRIGFLAEIRQWLLDPDQHRPAELTLYPTISVDSHSLTTYWATFWNTLGARPLARTPGALGAALVLAPVVLWVSWRLFRCPQRVRLALPYLLWLTAAATFGMPVSYDYNLIFLPVAAFAVCGWRDGIAGAVAIVTTFAWAQPFIVPPFPGHLGALFLLKLLSLFGIGACLVARARELDRPPLSDRIREQPSVLPATSAAPA